jgi:hypothetical protein
MGPFSKLKDKDKDKVTGVPGTDHYKLVVLVVVLKTHLKPCLRKDLNTGKNMLLKFLSTLAASKFPFRGKKAVEFIALEVKYDTKNEFTKG